MKRITIKMVMKENKKTNHVVSFNVPENAKEAEKTIMLQEHVDALVANPEYDKDLPEFFLSSIKAKRKPEKVTEVKEEKKSTKIFGKDKEEKKK